VEDSAEEGKKLPLPPLNRTFRRGATTTSGKRYKEKGRPREDTQCLSNSSPLKKRRASPVSPGGVSFVDHFHLLRESGKLEKRTEGKTVYSLLSDDSRSPVEKVYPSTNSEVIVLPWERISCRGGRFLKEDSNRKGHSLWDISAVIEETGEHIIAKREALHSQLSISRQKKKLRKKGVSQSN